MPAVTLVVCLYQERDLLLRLLEQTAGCYDDMVVVHDGPDTTGVGSIVLAAGGRFFEQPREFQQEPHWPFAWGKAKHDWILRLDADEFPSRALHDWLQKFRLAPEPPAEISGYTCIWPLWNGHHAASKKWPEGRNFLFNKHRVRFFGMVEQVPVPDVKFERLELTLEHRPGRKTHTIHDLLRPRAGMWRNCIATSLLGRPTDLNCWRWTDETWPFDWDQIRKHPVRTGFLRLLKGPLRGMREQWKTEGTVFPFAALSGPLHHALICLKYWQLRRKKKRPASPSAKSAARLR